MADHAGDIFTEPEADPDTLRNLGPLRRMAGLWEGMKSLDVNLGPNGPRRQVYHERIALQPMDPQTNGPQLLYGLHYVARMVKPGAVATYHHQTGYWLWEPATETVIHTLTIPRGQTAMAIGHAAADATRFELRAERGSTVNGICSLPFLELAFRTESFRIEVTLNPDGTWSYDEDTVLMVRGRPEPFHHTDRNTLTRIEDPTPNPRMRRP
ncbi:FABP family protein [Roseicella aquatilis]|uniref:FABP family protein n=1 Tax=Roseicella aquatilis TaxID=2527868 RepID=UPI0019801B68|nr:heme-binding beta-barrel domain-containing protein [Roseicella aquatilis]